MSSASALCVRIDELSAAIEAQKQVLKNLERSKSDAQQDLNAIREWRNYPSRSLPKSLSSRSLILSAPMATPPPWFISLDRPGAVNFRKLLEVWVSRTGNNLRLSFTLNGSLGNVLPVMAQYAHRVEHLTARPMEPWKRVEITSAVPSLTKLTLGTHHVMPTGFMYVPFRPMGPGAQRQWESDDFLVPCLQILKAAPNLVELDVESMVPRLASRPWAHPSLRHLRIGQDNGNKISSACILSSLTLPALETLLISDFDISAADLESFLTRSSPPLRSLNVMFERHIGNGYFQLLPRLADLTLTCSAFPSGFCSSMCWPTPRDTSDSSKILPFIIIIPPSKNTSGSLRVSSCTVTPNSDLSDYLARPKCANPTITLSRRRASLPRIA
ncbi:hypothetical protein C8F04DRAFT_1345017 [Mycena alexandri]|uniref:Uncharacterized protein n=1 Tax=Mycena alexandri TaxID=1745969 RepID=A0AAD6SXK4_9AGAR|nr:hypothetical protein C8F04DRAFT_1345017 [Mycena alexandri]